MAKAKVNTVEPTLQQSLRRHNITGPILLAISGGPDSVCLLHAMTKLVNNITLHVAHYNHHLRGETSDADALYVQQLCQQLSVPFHLGQASQGELRSGQSHLESQARNLRYLWLTQVAQQNGCSWIMTGHTMNDQAETVLHHLIRGTGWRGLRGIAPVRHLSSLPPQNNTQKIRLVRPLLNCSREQVLRYLQAHQLVPRHDASNDDLRFTRNRIRHQIMPQLLAMNGKVVQHLASWADVARRHYAQLQKESRAALSLAIVHETSDQLALNRRTLTLDQELLQELLRACWKRKRWPLDQMSSQRWKEVMEVVRGTRTAVELPGRIMVRAKHQVIQLTGPIR